MVKIMIRKNLLYWSLAVSLLGVAVNLWTHNYVFAAALGGSGLCFVAADLRTMGRLGAGSSRLLHWTGLIITATMVVISLRLQ